MDMVIVVHVVLQSEVPMIQKVQKLIEVFHGHQVDWIVDILDV